ncbi:MAG: hypothetical protein UY26_C0003G0282 [Candidatus Jorgensenbacteria bacterium GW2011_GWA1_48_13]|uniref:Uncharacterized protein n=1 Tax=Candidatus Jorgensenbacteria bacterium GW2011_GWB1_50_10 TaxID=1618665 RepID=A0A0G1W893_9BACT|nr:MAG: hypothetical protein UY26_C0003G0282 [Candidatus Jorgensenbacteria bacterium GW2011_GWA1_48_13]KKW14830.1 MAG: hypothetical protein UY55_C0003G0046 [Candidatus Jorgensenbacteria bacterium GW2011_GWB1_50_10]
MCRYRLYSASHADASATTTAAFATTVAHQGLLDQVVDVEPIGRTEDLHATLVLPHLVPVAAVKGDEVNGDADPLTFQLGLGS